MLVQIDASTACQLRCPSCPTASGAAHPTLGTRHLALDDFERLLDGNPEVTEVELSNYGEMFLNPQLEGILEAAHRRGVVVHADNGANMNHVGAGVTEALVRTRFRSMTVSIDGASPETYARYRVRGDFDRVIGHLRALDGEKRARASSFPRLTWQLVVFGHNEHEIERARAMAASLGMAFFAKLTWDEAVSPLRDEDLVRRRTGWKHTTRTSFRQETGLDPMRGLCHQLWTRAVVNADGKNLGCCRNFWGEFGGNAFRDGLQAIASSEKITHAREMLLGRAPARDDVPCSTCSMYEMLRDGGRWLTPEEVQPHPEGSAVGVHVRCSDASVRSVEVRIAGGAKGSVQRIPVRDERADAFFSVSPGTYTVAARPADRDAAYAVALLEARGRPALHQVVVDV